jgi:ribonuclease P protein component
MGYPQRKSADAGAFGDLTMHSRARSNTALFRTGGNGDQADLPTLQDEARAASRLSGAQPHARRPGRAAQPASRRSPPPRVVVAGIKRYGLGGARRLRRKADFERLLRQGARRSLAGYTFFLEQRDAGHARLGVLVSRKHSKAATQRNGIKRCIREAFRLEQDKLGALDVLVRPPYGVLPSSEMIMELRGLLTRVKG